MDILKHMRRERSGLAFTTLELAKYEARAGHNVCIKEPTGGVIHGRNGHVDLHTIHSQIDPMLYKDNVPKIMFMHGEPLSSVGNGVSMNSIVDLAPICDVFIAMRKEEVVIWNTIKRTWLVDKGVDLERFKPLPGIIEKLSGEPAVLYCESWRQTRNPLYLCVAMQIVHQKYPNARLHLYNVTDKRQYATFDSLIKHNKWWTFIRSLKGPVDDVAMLMNKVDIVVSCLSELYARTPLEALACGKAAICPGYRSIGDYPFVARLEPQSLANAIIAAWEAKGQFNFRAHAEKYHNVENTVRQCEEIYRRYV